MNRVTGYGAPLISETEVIVIGGGIVGMCVAAFLAEEGKEVACIDDGHHSGSTANAGSLHVQMQSRNIRLSPHLVPALEQSLPMYIRAVKAWKQLALQLDSNIELTIEGGLMVAEDTEQLEFLKKKCAREQFLGLNVEMLDRVQIERIAPYLGKSVIGAEFCADEGKVNPLLANSAIERLAITSGVHFFRRLRIDRLEISGNAIHAHTTIGIIRASRIVIAAGSGSGHLAEQLDIHIPTLPEPLHMNVTEPTAPMIPHLIQHAERSITMKQLPAGNIVIGGGWPADIFGPKEHPTVRMDSLINNLILAKNIVPAINSLHLIRTWAGINSITDGRSVLGQAKNQEQVYFALPGDAGYTLGPLCARLIVDLMQGRVPEIPIEQYSPMRFSGGYERMHKEIV
jgi:glycine/D-amino acid oxidase-like deaminating enzyme|tara:strand:+ start:4684 stop:5880 length:1197 start_codon:yes stop_codon:yes gene_type:complete